MHRVLERWLVEGAGSKIVEVILCIIRFSLLKKKKLRLEDNFSNFTTFIARKCSLKKGYVENAHVLHPLPCQNVAHIRPHGKCL